MYPLLRLLTTSIRALRAPAMPPDGVAETHFRCRPWDLDMFMEMNNGRVLTLYDLGRFDFAIRSGLAKTLKQQGWGLVVAGSTVRYRKRIKLFDSVTIRTQVVGIDERWIYVKQSMWLKGEPASSVLLRTGVTSQGRSVKAEQVIKAMGMPDWKPAPSDWPKAWIESESLRPWPPVHSQTTDTNSL
ncbi:acyl-CoA thioesterase [Ferrimonas gelatinilytica]|uniref:Acyl-CoA thioesterase n=1 Tax=Ferrimonas gelatinilytica TaxID=1255257 RepID=A0ABP9S1J8_9GAMM